MSAGELKEVSSAKVFGGYIKEFKHTSKSVGGTMEFGVYIPPGAGKNGVKVPALMYLSGLTCSPKNCIQKGGAFQAAAAEGLMLIFPDTSPRDCKIEGDSDSWDFGTAAGFYLNATEPKWKANYQMDTYVNEELPALIAKHFPFNGKISVTGHSMGGHGALVCYLRNPGKYESASAFAPICNPSNCPWGVKAFTGYLGPDKSKWAAYDATMLVKEFKGERTEILIDQGLEDGFYKKNQLLPEAFVEACKGAKHPLKCNLQEGYDHSYFFVSTFMPSHIAFHAKALKK